MTVWIAGRGLDRGHPGAKDDTFVSVRTEIHPPQAIVTLRLNHPSGNIPFVNKPYLFDVPNDANYGSDRHTCR